MLNKYKAELVEVGVVSNEAVLNLIKPWAYIYIGNTYETCVWCRGITIRRWQGGTKRGFDLGRGVRYLKGNIRQDSGAVPSRVHRPRLNEVCLYSCVPTYQ